MTDNKIRNPTNPTDDFEEMINDKSGLTGITTNTNHNNQNVDDNDIADIKDSSDYKYKSNEEKGFTTDNPNPQYSNIPPEYENLNELDVSAQNETLNDAETPAVDGEQSVSGDMPDPASDDDTLSNAHDMGIGLNENTEHPQELDIASDIDSAEEFEEND